MLEAYAKACGDTPWVIGGLATHELSPIVSQQGGRVINHLEELGAFCDEING
jgi:hypothetical protein